MYIGINLYLCELANANDINNVCNEEIATKYIIAEKYKDQNGKMFYYDIETGKSYRKFEMPGLTNYGKLVIREGKLKNKLIISNKRLKQILDILNDENISKNNKMKDKILKK